MGEHISTLGGRIIDSGFASALILGLIAMAMITTRQPSRRRALARAGVLSTLLTIPLVCFRPFATIDIVEPVRGWFEPTLTMIHTQWDRFIVGNSQWVSQLPTNVIAYLPIVILTTYLLGVTFGLGRIALGLWGAGWVDRNSKPPRSETLVLYQSLQLVSGRSYPKIRVSDRTAGPVLLGTIRSNILIPPDFDRPEMTECLRLGLLHELAHYESSDPLFTLATEVAWVFWFPLPPLWWIRKQMRLDQEFLADRHAAERFGASSRYATSLVKIAESPSLTADSSAGVRATPARGGTELFQRILMLVRCPFPVEGQPPSWWRWSLFTSTTLLLLAVTTITIRASSITSSRVKPHECRSLSMRTLVLNESPLAPGLTVLPVRLPATFELSLQVYASDTELADIMILGHPLGRERSSENPLIQDPSRWHRVKLIRATGQLSLALDSEPMKPFAANSVEEWLSLGSIPGRRTTFRSLLLTW